MNKIDADTKKISDCASKIIDEIVKYDENIDNYFTVIKDVTSKSQEWVGDVAENFTLELYKKKQIYEDYGKELANFADLIKDCAYNLDKAVEYSKMEE